MLCLISLRHKELSVGCVSLREGRFLKRQHERESDTGSAADTYRKKAIMSYLHAALMSPWCRRRLTYAEHRKGSAALYAWPWLLLPILVWVTEKNTVASPSRACLLTPSNISALKWAFALIWRAGVDWTVVDRLIWLNVCVWSVGTWQAVYLHQPVWRWRSSECI